MTDDERWLALTDRVIELESLVRAYRNRWHAEKHWASINVDACPIEACRAANAVLGVQAANETDEVSGDDSAS